MPDTKADLLALTVDLDTSRMFGRVFKAAHAEGELTPAVILLHGFPGTELNLDLASELRDNGITAVTFHYRGVWGSTGKYSFSNLAIDAMAVADYVYSNASALDIDPDRVFFFGHSMGGFAALRALSLGQRVRGAILACPCDVGMMYLDTPDDFNDLASVADLCYFYGVTSNDLAHDASENAAAWRFDSLALPRIPYLFIGGKEDEVTPAQQHIEPLYARLRGDGQNVQYDIIDDSHSFPSSRKLLSSKVLSWLAAVV